MMKLKILVISWIVFGAALVARQGPFDFAQDRPARPKPPMSDEVYAKTMKDIGSTFRSLQFNNKAMNHTDGERQARRLANWFRDVQTYWEAKHVDDAVAFAKTAVDAAERIRQASTQMNMAVLAEMEKTLASTCEGCHMRHRETVSEGVYRIK